MSRSYLPLSAALSVAVMLLSSASVRPASAEGKITRREANRLSVDVVTLKIGGELRGAIASRTPTEIQMVVRRTWLAEHQPELLQSLPPTDGDDERLSVLVDRIDAWLADRGAASKRPYSPEPQGTNDDPQASKNADLLRVLKAERQTYQEYLDDPLKLPPGEGTAEARRDAYRQLVTKLDTWVAELEGGPADVGPSTAERQQQNREELIRILKSERDDYAKQLKAGDPKEASDFVRVTLSRADVGLLFAQSDERRQLAVAAFQHDVDDVETAGVAELQKELETAGVDWKTANADASALVGGGMPQSDREWAARRAIYEYEFLRRLDFQGTGDFVVQTGDDAPPPNMGDLMQGLLNQQTSNALGDLLDEPVFTGLDFGGLVGKKNSGGWLDKATRIAGKQGVRGFRVTRMTPDVQRRATVVDDRFLAKMPDGTWATIWTTQETKSARDANPHDLDRIKEDPQLKEALGLVESLGLGGNGNLDLALQFGAATMNAQQATDDEFYEFRNRYSQRLDGPPLTWK